ncbi:hypothetical protein OG21DRAFT_1220288 [Imleria badia]|nr:hypothetical protein OG21DRAFT_1220288 [Imleria badia]
MSLMGVPIQSILFTVFQSIFQVFLLCLAGFTLSFKGIVDKPTSKALNRINIALFTPALLFSKVAFVLTPGMSALLSRHSAHAVPSETAPAMGHSHLLCRPDRAICSHCTLARSRISSKAISSVRPLSRSHGLSDPRRNFATAASMFMNSNSLPVALMQSLATTVPLLKWGPDDTIDAMFGRSLIYLAVFSTVGMILRWSYGMHLLSQTDEPESPVIHPPTTYRDVDNTRVSDPSTAHLIDYETEAVIDPRDQHVLCTSPLRSGLPHSPLSRRHTHPHQHSHLPAVPTSLGDQCESEDTDELETTEGDSEDTIALRSEQVDPGFFTDAEDQTPSPSPAPASSLSEPTQRWDRPARPSLFRRLLKMPTSLSPPLIASLFALFCVLVPPVQRLLKSEEMIPFKGALDSAGACSVPITLLVLGGWFWDGDSKPKSPRSRVEDEIKGGSDDQGPKSKGKGVKKSKSQHAPHHLVSPSRDSSTASLSSMIGAIGDVLMLRMHPSRRSDRSRRRVRGIVDGSTIDDVEPGLLATHTEAEIEHAENRLGCASRSRSRTSPMNGRARPSPIFPSSSLHPEPTSPPARATNANTTGETLTIFITLFTRMVVVPLIATPMMVIISRLGWGGEVFEDPVFIVSSMLLISSPPALALAQVRFLFSLFCISCVFAYDAVILTPPPQISQRAKTTTVTGAPADANAFSPFERLLSRTIFWAYLVLTPPIAIASVMVGLLMIGA